MTVSTTPTSASKVFRFGPADVTVEPYPHVFSDTFLTPELYERLKAEFPGDDLFENKSQFGGRTGRDFYSPDPGFQEFLRSAPAWREFHDYIHSPAFIEFVLSLFGRHLATFDCAVEPDKAAWVDFQEERAALVKKPLLSRICSNLRSALKHKPDWTNDLYARFDIEQGGKSYAKPVHCDLPNRLASLVLYFSDADEIQMDGGELSIHEHLEKKPYRRYERYPEAANTRVVKTVRPRENTGLLFLCSNNSYHSVSEIASVQGYRKFIYLNVSSRADSIW